MRQALVGFDSNDVLIGGQSILFWCNHFDIEYDIKGALTSDIDVLGTQESVFKIAKNTNGTASLQLVLISQVSYKEYRRFTPLVKYLKN